MLSLGAVSGETGHLSEIFASYQGEGARVGEKQLFVRFAGCHLRCTYCDTPASLVRVPSCEVSYPDGATESLANPISVADLARVIGRCLDEDPEIGCIAITGGEPMLQQRFILAWFTEAPPAVSCLLETSATVAQGLEGLLPWIDVVSADIKLPSNSGEPPQWERHRDFLKRCHDGDTDVYVKMPVSSDTSDDEVRYAARLARETVPDAPLYLQPISDPDGGEWRLHSSRLLALTAAAASEARLVCMLPQMHKLLAIR